MKTLLLLLTLTLLMGCETLTTVAPTAATGASLAYGKARDLALVKEVVEYCRSSAAEQASIDAKIARLTYPDTVAVFCGEQRGQ